MMKKALLTLLLAFVGVTALFAQSTPQYALKVDSVSSCDSYRWSRNNQLYVRDTVVMHTVGDTTFVLYFTKMNSYIDTAVAVEISGACSATWDGKTWTEMGSFLDTLTAVSGCDSIVKINVTLALYDTLKTVVKCGSYTAPWGEVYTESRVIDTTITSGECTYHNVINLTVHPEYVNQPVIEVTAGCVYIWKDMTLTDTMPHSKTYKTVEGQCDSIETLRVIAYTGEQSDTVSVVACDAYKPAWSADSLYASNVYVHDSVYGTYLTSNGTQPCLHHDAIDLTIITSVSDSNVTPTLITAGCSYRWNGVTYTDTNVHHHLYTSVIGGCDSMAAIKISYTFNDYDTTKVNYCGDAYNWKTNYPSLPLPGSASDYRFTQNTDTTVTVVNADSTCTTHYTLNLTFFTKKDTVEEYKCGNSFNYTYKKRNSQGNWVNATATFTSPGYFEVAPNGDSLISVASGSNCVTFRTLNLDLNIPEQRFRADSIDTAVCEKFSFKADNKYGSLITLSASSSNNNEVIIDSNICHQERHSRNRARCYDSIVHVHLIIHRNTIIQRNATVCDSYIWEEFNNETYTTSGTYRDTLPERDNNGCLQIGRLTLTVNKTPVINIEGRWVLEPGDSTLLKAVPAEGSDAISNYKWYVDDVLTQSGANADSLLLENVQSNTEVRLESKSVKNCTAINWLTVTANVGIDEVETLQVNIYPNPASRYLNIESAETLGEVVIYNALGQQAVRRTVGGNAVQLDLGHLATGTYTLRINGADGSLTTRKIIVNK